jgi:hypothetical protein
MTDAYYPEFDPGIMDAAPRAARHDPVKAGEADQRRNLAALVPDTRRARYAVLENHCRQARAGYYCCQATPADPCGYSANLPYPHDRCTAERCEAPHTCDDIAAYAAAVQQ